MNPLYSIVIGLLVFGILYGLWYAIAKCNDDNNEPDQKYSLLMVGLTALVGAIVACILVCLPKSRGNMSSSLSSVPYDTSSTIILSSTDDLYPLPKNFSRGTDRVNPYYYPTTEAMMDQVRSAPEMTSSSFVPDYASSAPSAPSYSTKDDLASLLGKIETSDFMSTRIDANRQALAKDLVSKIRTSDLFL